MANLNRLRVAWGGTGPVGPSVSTLFFSGTMTGRPAAVVTLLDAVKAQFPAGMTWDIPSSGDTLEDSTGVLTGGWTASGGGQVVATGTGNYAAGVGARVVWNTTAVFQGRRVHGAMFWVPLVVSQFDASGTINNGTLTTWQTALNTFIAAVTPDLKVYSRPRPNGAYATSAVTSASVPDKVTTLRTRRT